MPADGEWKTLELFLGMDSTGVNLIFPPNNYVACLIREPGTSHWYYPNTSANNLSVFTALPAGYRWRFYQEFSTLHERANFWTSTAVDAANAWYYTSYYNLIANYRTYTLKNYGFSVRCVRDN